ncbi:MAG: outer membrane lipoprotein-sorting protein [Deltaproteobacteria bacterium]|nr:outer membrane lipoprotein-sorting protein [Deltaproteobacteria bacterium]MBW2140955.1 outer membrane lipoprotein-sorting protein [Deltaproteobacteria bacterium]MBW2324123.1 outer membrane lipoprotein-sorting protein [Deltaproteobacteria bacterium]
MKRIMIFLSMFLLSLPVSAQALTGEEILNKIDQNMVVEEAVSITKMVIHSRTGTRTIKSKTWIKGEDKAFVEYLSPPREKGKKMLKIGDKIWNYTPEPNDRIITISGHLLRQSVMGSDLSYEDMTENHRLAELYEATLEGQAEFAGRNCYILQLAAKKKNVAYHSRKLWVDAERWLPLKEERFARGGRLLKRFEIKEVFKIEDRWYPKKMIFKDVLSKGKGTEYYIESIDFNVKIPDYKLTKAALRK